MNELHESANILHHFGVWLQGWAAFAWEQANALPGPEKPAKDGLPADVPYIGGERPPAHWLAKLPSDAPPEHWLKLLAENGFAWPEATPDEPAVSPTPWLLGDDPIDTTDPRAWLTLFHQGVTTYLTALGVLEPELSDQPTTVPSVTSLPDAAPETQWPDSAARVAERPPRADPSDGPDANVETPPEAASAATGARPDRDLSGKRDASKSVGIRQIQPFGPESGPVTGQTAQLKAEEKTLARPTGSDPAQFSAPEPGPLGPWSAVAIPPPATPASSEASRTAKVRPVRPADTLASLAEQPRSATEQQAIIAERPTPPKGIEIRERSESSISQPTAQSSLPAEPEPALQSDDRAAGPNQAPPLEAITPAATVAVTATPPDGPERSGRHPGPSSAISPAEQTVTRTTAVGLSIRQHKRRPNRPHAAVTLPADPSSVQRQVGQGTVPSDAEKAEPAANLPPHAPPPVPPALAPKLDAPAGTTPVTQLQPEVGRQVLQSQASDLPASVPGEAPLSQPGNRVLSKAFTLPGSQAHPSESMAPPALPLGPGAYLSQPDRPLPPAPNQAPPTLSDEGSQLVADGLPAAPMRNTGEQRLADPAAAAAASQAATRAEDTSTPYQPQPFTWPSLPQAYEQVNPGRKRRQNGARRHRLDREQRGK